jgi:hypothetical protein
MSNQIDEVTGWKIKPVLDYKLSLMVAFITDAQPNYCYANTWHAITDLAMLQDAQLIEGWIVLEQEMRVLLIEHCWCETADGLIVDPSIVLLFPQSQPVRYFSGIRRDQFEVKMLTCRDLPYVRSVGTYGSDGMGHTDYRAAYHAASAQASAWVSESDPPKSLIVQPSIPPRADSERVNLTVRIVSSTNFQGEL